MQNLSSTPSISQIPLYQLVVSAQNVRKTQTDVRELSESIASLGLLQNLSAVKKGDQYQVVAGGRRLTALQLLAKQKRIASDFSVPVLVVESEDAISVSLSENVAREQMHPADEFDAFKTMIDSGASIEEVAAKFGATPNAVNRRLKLANVAPSLMQTFRQGEIALDKLMALATTDDHALQESVWENASDYDEASDLREAILGQSQTLTSQDKLAVFVGLEAYQEAGGTLQADLFSQDNPDGHLINDTALLRELATNKMQAIADGLVSSGQANWVDISIDRESRDYQNYRIVYPKLSKVPAEVKAQIKAIEAQMKRLESAKYELDDEDENYDDDYQAFDSQIEALDAQIEDIQAPYMKFDKIEAPFVGTFIGLKRDGSVAITSGLIRKQDEAQIKKLQEGKTKPSLATEGNDDMVAAGKPEHPTSLITALTAHRTIALQATIANEPNKALVLLVAKLLLSSVHSYGSQVDVVKVSNNNAFNSLSRHDESVKDGLAFTALAAIREKWAYLLDSENLLKDLAKLEQGDLLSILAYLTAISVDAVSFNNGESDSYEAVGQFVGLEINDWFTPNAVNYFGKLSKDVLIAKILAKDPKADGLGKKKRGELATMAESLYENSGYQPEFMEV